MKKLRSVITAILPVLLLLTWLAGSGSAALLDVGPTVPEVIPSSPPQHGFPLWYRDQAGTALELCLSAAESPNAPGNTMCNLLPGATFDPALPMVFPTNFPDEGFWWATDAVIKNGSVRALLVMAVEAAWNTGAIVSGDQITFARMRIMVDTPVAGSYRVVFPYGVRTFDNVPAGTHAIFYTEDIGIQVGNFQGALQGGAGPFLRWDTGVPINVNGELFIGDPNVDHTITGSPLGTNYFRIEGPPGSNLDGLGHDFVQTDLFAVTGKIYQQPIPTPLAVDKAVYARDPAGAQVSVFATTKPVSNQGTPSALQASGAGIPTTPMATNVAADGKFFSATGLFTDPGTMPANITVTNTADVPPTAVDATLTDEVTVSQATYLPLTRTLTIAAASSDRVALPALQAYMPGMTAPLGTLAAGQLVVNFPVTDSSTVPASVYETPPLTVTVKSAAGGALTAPVLVKDQVDLPPTGSIVINAGAALTNLANATLTLSATDDSGIVAQMQFSRDGVTWFPWEPFAVTRTVNLAAVPGDGIKTIYVRFKDGNGNVSLSYSDTIIYDATAPTGTISIDNGAAYTKVGTATLTLSASDANGVTQMQFSKNGGVNWGPWETFSTTRVLSSLPSVPGPDGVREVFVRFKDAAGNVSAPISDTIIYDTAGPSGTISINGGAATTKVGTATLTLSASDPSGVTQMQFSKNGGVNWLPWETFSTTRVLSSLPSVPGPDGVKEIFVRFKDAVGNISAPISDTIIYDTTAPTGTMAIDGGAVYNSLGTATLNLTASDANGVTQMQFSKNGGVNWVPWEPFSATRRISLPSVPGADGVREVFVRYQDAAGNVSAPISDTIIYDHTPPTGTVRINGGEATTASATVILTLSAIDTTSGVAQMQFSKDGGVTWFPWEAFAITRSITLAPAGPGLKTIDVRFKDTVGNISPKVQTSITVL